MNAIAILDLLLLMNQFNSSQEILEELRRKRNAHPELYITVPKKPLRTLLLMGPSRAGKSTISETLEDSLHEPNEPTLYSGIRNPDPKQINGLRIIDMPSFNDIQALARNSLSSNQLIISMLQKQLTGNDSVHLVAFVFSLADGIKQEDINGMIFVQSNFPQLAGKMMLVVTHAEELNHEEKDRLVEEFFQHPEVQRNNLRNFFKQGIMFLGCLRYESYTQKNYPALRNEHQNVLEMRKKFIEKCFAEVPSTNSQQLNNNNPLSPSILHNPADSLKKYVLLIIIALLCYIIYSRLSRDSSSVSSTNQIDDSTSTNGDTLFNYHATESNKGLSNSLDGNTSALDIINEILKDILLEMKKSNQRSENFEKNQENSDRRLENIEHILLEMRNKNLA